MSSDSSPTGPNLIRLAAICRQREGEWLKGKGCGMTEKLCSSMYEGRATWLGGVGQGCRAPKPTMGFVCNHEGMQGGTDYDCYIQYIPTSEWQIKN